MSLWELSGIVRGRELFCQVKSVYHLAKNLPFVAYFVLCLIGALTITSKNCKDLFTLLSWIR